MVKAGVGRGGGERRRATKSRAVLLFRQSGTFIGRPVGGKERRERVGAGKEEEGRGREGRGREEGGKEGGRKEGRRRKGERRREERKERGGREGRGRREEEGGEEKEVYKSYNLHGWRGDRYTYPEGKNFDSSSGSIVSSLRSSR